MALTTVPASLSATALTLTTAAQPNITSVGTLTSLTVDDITINGSTISDAADFLLDVGGDISFDADGGDIRLLDGGTQFGKFTRDGGDFLISSSENDKDIKFAGADGGANITALTLDMSEAGAATFNSTVATGGNLTVNGNTNLTGNLTVDSTTLYVNSSSNTVGIGTTSPSFTAVSGSTSQRGLHIQNSGNDTSAHLKLTAHNNTGTPGQATDFEIIHRGDALRTIFRHGGADALTLDSSGNLGIGVTPSGTYKLQVNGGIQLSAKSLIDNSAYFISGTNGFRWNNSSDAYNNCIMYDNGNMYVRGQVGIGATPSGSIALEVVSSGEARIKAKSTNNNWAGLDLESNSTQSNYIFFRDNSAERARIQVTDGNEIRFNTTSSVTERMRIYSDGKVDIKNSGTDKIVRFINTGSGTQGVTIGTTTGNSAGTGVHIGHQGTKAFIHPYNYAGGSYQQMEIACSDFVLKVNGSASGMTMDSSANSIFYGDVKINDANDRLIMNGVAREAKGGYIQGNQTVSYTINHTSQSAFHVRCGFNHYGLLSYGCVLDQIFANGPGGISSATATISSTTGPGGGWSVARVDSTNVTVSKSAGNYAGGGYYYIIVEGANL